MAEGRVVAYPGAEVIVGTEAAGRIIKLPVEEKSVVNKGDLVAELNADGPPRRRGRGRGTDSRGRGRRVVYQLELKREEDLVARRAGTAQNVDSPGTALDAARARRGRGWPRVTGSRPSIAKTRITAPLGGVVTARHVQPGETIELAAEDRHHRRPDRVRIEAEVDEYDTARVALGAPVAIVAEGFPDSLARPIEEIPDAVVGRKLRPEDPGRPVDARVLPVKIALTGPTPLKLGQRVEVEIEYRAPNLADRSH